MERGGSCVRSKPVKRNSEVKERRMLVSIVIWGRYIDVKNASL